MRIKYIILSVIVTLAAITIQFARYYPIACNNYAANGIKAEITKKINSSFAEGLDYESIAYKDIANINKKNDGTISSINVDTGMLNAVALKFSNKIIECIENTENSFGIPLGNALGSKILSGKGAKINVNILPIGAPEYEIESKLLSSGINQTLHRISICFKTEIQCLAPFHESKCSINTTIVIAETLIVGEVPEVILHR